MLDLAAKHAVRAWGRVEPNPLVGCVLARRVSGREGSGESGGAFDAARRAGWEVIGIGHHRRFGGAHAEVEALRNARDGGADPRGATAWVTLEPCDHTGKTGPCSKALLDAGVAEVVFARHDPNPISAGGAATLAKGGVAARVCGASEAAMRLAQPFIASLLTRDKPWLIAKWAQTPDGRMVTTPGEPRWISGERSRRRVHELRARVDAIITGVGTVIADDPALTVRRGGGATGGLGGAGSSGRSGGVRGSVRGRPPLRVVMDSAARTPLRSAVVKTARAVPTLVLCADGAESATGAIGTRARALRERGVDVEACAASDGRVHLREAMASLARRGVKCALLEAGPTLLREACAAGLVDEAWAFIAGAAGDATLARQASAIVAPMLENVAAWADAVNARSGEDRLVIWRRAER